MEDLGFVVLALGILGFGLVSGKLQKSVITPPMVFTLFGFLVSQQALGLVQFDLDGRLIHLLAELTLVLVLFTDAARIDLRVLRREHDLPVRLLVVGLPLTIIAGALVAAVLFDRLSFWQAAVAAAILAPTDAALGQAVVSARGVPVRIRQALNIESGLNDGMVLPVVLILASAAGAASGAGESAGFWARFVAMQLALGPLIGIAVGYLGGKLVERATRTGWMSHTFQELAALGLSLLAFAAAEMAGGNGFIAVFCAGLALGNSSRAVCSCLFDFAEAEGQLLNLLIFAVFGAVLAPVALEHMNWGVLSYAVLSLTVIRMLPVTLALLGARLRMETVLFLGWFGPRGLASILFALLVVEESHLAGGSEIMVIVTSTVLLSIFAHGLTSYPGASRFAARLKRLKTEACAVELQPVTEMPVRLAHRGD